MRMSEDIVLLGGKEIESLTLRVDRRLGVGVPVVLAAFPSKLLDIIAISTAVEAEQVDLAQILNKEIQ